MLGNQGQPVQQIPPGLFLQSKGNGCGQGAEFLLVDSASFEAISWLQMAEF